MNTEEQIYPSHAMIEKTILANFIKSPEHLFANVLQVKPAYFHVENYAFIYNLMYELVKQNLPIDTFILLNYLTKVQPDIDWKMEFEALKNWEEENKELPYFIAKLEENYVNRQFVSIALKMSDVSIPISERLNFSIQQLLELKNDKSYKTEEPLSKLLVYFVRNGGMVEKAQQIRSGITKLDRLMYGGFERGQLVVFGGRPGMGKTALLMTICNKIIDEGMHKVMFISLNLNPKHFLTKMLSNRLNYPTLKILKGEFPEDYNASCNRLLEAEKTGEFKYHFQINNDFMNLMAEINSQRLSHGVDVVIIDNLQMLEEINPIYYQNRNNTIGKNLRRLKQMALEFNFLLLIGSELSRSTERRSGSSCRPMLSDLKDSGAIEELADKVIMIYRPEYYQLSEWEDGEPTKDTGELMVCKNSMGHIENVKVAFNSDSFRFSDYIETDFYNGFDGNIPLSRSNEFEVK
jgi:replicative DNA helicase